MIKIDKENLKIETDCKTVGEFMTEAAAIFGGNVTIIADGCRYEFHDTPKIMVTDETPIATVVWDYHGGGGMSGGTSDQFTILTKPKPKTVRREGWVNVYRLGFENYKTTTYRMSAPQIYNCKEAADQAVRLIGYDERRRFVATTRIEWEEVAQ